MTQRREKIICVKIAQHKLRHSQKTPIYDYFPYDRVYLAREKLAPVFRKTFRYYLSMPLDKDLLQALNSLHVDNLCEISVERNDLRREGTPGTSQDNFQKLIRNHRGWIMVVPTHVRTVYGDAKKFKNPYASSVGYLMSRAIQRGHNEKVMMPQIAFHTPTRTIPVLCAVCKNLPGYHSNQCTPGTFTCKSKAESELALDNEFYNNSKRSVEEAGGEA